MNDLPYSEIREETETYAVNLLLHDGWILLRIYLRKRQVRHTEPLEFEEYPVYVLGNLREG
jgi:hypothetical protein